MSDTKSTSRAVLVAHLLIVSIIAGVLIRLIQPGQVVGADIQTRLLSLGRMALLLILATASLRLRGLRWRDVGLARPRVGALVLGVFIGLVLAVASVAAANLVSAQQGWGKPDYSVFRPLKGNLYEYLYWAGPVTLFSAAFGEELMFRGWLRDGLQRMFGGPGGEGRIALGLAILLQAVVFGALHAYQGPVGMLTAGATGLAFGATWLISGRNLWAGILLHAVFDLGSMTAFYLGMSPGA